VLIEEDWPIIAFERPDQHDQRSAEDHNIEHHLRHVRFSAKARPAPHSTSAPLSLMNSKPLGERLCRAPSDNAGLPQLYGASR
jgi:hypothetical protein